LYGFAAVLGSLERAGLGLVRFLVALSLMKVFCLFVQKEALSFWVFILGAGQRFSFEKKNQKTFS
jgi:hypothetical protein